MSELSELYQEVILDHNRRPRNFYKIEDADRVAEGTNPLCGDQVTVYAKIDGDVIQDLSFQGQGCAIAKASASMMTASLKGKTTQEAHALFESVHEMLTGGMDPDAAEAELGRLAVLSGVRQYPVRVKCASLSWHALRAALRGTEPSVTTE
jgi:nitrogen fixation NifU-like protein